MATIDILQPADTAEGEPTIKEKIEIEEIQLSRIAPADIQNGIPISMSKLSNLISEICPLDEPQQDVLDNYFAQQIPVYYDENLSPQKLDIPHHIGLRVVLESILNEYGISDNLQILIG